MMNGEFNLQGQQLNSFSLQRSEMFLATSAGPKISLRLAAKLETRTLAQADNGDCAPTELWSKEKTTSL